MLSRFQLHKFRARVHALALALVAITLSSVPVASAQGVSIPTDLVSATPAGDPGNALSSQESISSDGRYVAFRSSATDLVPGGGPQSGVYLRDHSNGTLHLVYAALPGESALGPVISADGSVVAFSVFSFQGNTSSIYAYDVLQQSVSLTSVGLSGGPAGGYSQAPSVSRDGRLVAFMSTSEKLVTGDFNQNRDVFVADRLTGIIERVSVGDNDIEADDSSSIGPMQKFAGDGRFIAFYSRATNLVPNDTNGVTDVFIRDRQLGTTLRASLGAGGAELSHGTSQANLSASGRRLLFSTSAPELVAGDTLGFEDVFARNLVTGAVTLLSRNAQGLPCNHDSRLSGVSPDGSWALVGSQATDFDAVDGGRPGTYLVEVETGAARRIILDYRDDPPIRLSTGALSEGARHLAFTANESSVIVSDLNGAADVFRRHLDQGYLPMIVQTFCSGDGTAAACGCGGSNSPAGFGCTGFFGGARSLGVEGLASVTTDSLRLVTSAYLSSSVFGTPGGIFVSGSMRMNNGMGLTFGQGLLCVSGTLVRLGAFAGSSIADINVSHGYPSATPLSIAAGPVTPGSTTHYQYLFRTPSIPPGWCMDRQGNGTNGLSVTWLP